MSDFEQRWTIVHEDADGSTAIRNNARIIDAGPGWIQIHTQIGTQHTIPFTQLTSLRAQEPQEVSA